MTDDEAVARMIDVLDELDIPYMLVGSLSSGLYGVSRSTKDADFVLEMEGRRVREIAEKLGPEFQLDPQVLFETVTGTTRYVIEVPSIPFRIDCFRLSSDDHDLERFRRRENIHFDRFHRAIFVPKVEDVIITKLRWSLAGDRGKDAEDIAHIIAVQGDAIDWDYVHRWCNEHGTRDRLDEIRESIPPIE